MTDFVINVCPKAAVAIVTQGKNVEAGNQGECSCVWWFHLAACWQHLAMSLLPPLTVDYVRMRHCWVDLEFSPYRV